MPFSESIALFIIVIAMLAHVIIVGLIILNEIKKLRTQLALMIEDKIWKMADRIADARIESLSRKLEKQNNTLLRRLDAYYTGILQRLAELREHCLDKSKRC